MPLLSSLFLTYFSSPLLIFPYSPYPVIFSSLLPSLLWYTKSYFRFGKVGKLSVGFGLVLGVRLGGRGRRRGERGKGEVKRKGIFSLPLDCAGVSVPILAARIQYPMYRPSSRVILEVRTFWDMDGFTGDGGLKGEKQIFSLEIQVGIEEWGKMVRYTFREEDFFRGTFCQYSE